MTCMCCAGKGEQSVEVSHFGEQRTEVYNVPCIWCNGTGNMTEQQKCVYKGYLDIWCKCGKHTDVTFIDDNKNRKLKKHHWVCNKCGKITQIG